MIFYTTPREIHLAHVFKPATRQISKGPVRMLGGWVFVYFTTVT